MFGFRVSTTRGEGGSLRHDVLTNTESKASASGAPRQKPQWVHSDLLHPASAHSSWTVNKRLGLRFQSAVFVALKSTTPLLASFYQAYKPVHPPSLLLVFLLLSKQPNEAEGQQSARASLLHYAHIHSLSHKQSNSTGKQNRQLHLSLSVHIFARQSRTQATPLEKEKEKDSCEREREGGKKKHHTCSACVRAEQVHESTCMCLTLPPPSLVNYIHRALLAP